MISEWYDGRSILITGATGFMGKVLVEKLLRSCPRIETIYVLIRPKRGMQVKDRLHQLLSLTIFDEIRKMPGQLEKVQALESDTTLPSLGLSLEDQTMLRDKVSVIFHSAATVKFEEPLKEAVAVNMTSTRSVVHLALTMSKLEAMVHVSTAYCNCDKLEVAEQIYPTGQDPDKVISAVESLDQDLLTELTPRMLGNRPNTYTFTKALAEEIVYEQSGILPIAIVRPSIVVAGWKEPMPGWVDNMNGPTGLLVAGAKGVLRTMLCDRRNIADLIPVDIAINFCIAAAWYTAKCRPNYIVVYNCTTGAKNPIKWGELERWGQEFTMKYPPVEMLWYPNGTFKRYRFTNLLARVLFHWTPAYLLDFASRITGNRPAMVKVQEKLYRACNTLEFFTIREFKFNNDNMMEVWHTLCPEDRKTFPFDVTALDWKSYIETYVQGTRAYLLKEDPSTIPQARRNLFRLYILDCLAHIMFFFGCFWFLFRKSSLTKKFLLSLVSIMLKTAQQLRLQHVNA